MQPIREAAPKKPATKEFFAESEYGVKASPRVTTQRSNVRRGGGREHVGKPYQVRGQWYHPKEVSSYSKTGKASWYGDAFHGRLTANGEIYDMTHLTAAHPTLPLPSYARVTNLDNGSSVIVRINDRGPFSRGRIIDLSKRAAEMLDYTSRGVASVKVDYIGPAPLHGQDDQYLLASYRPGGSAPDPSDGLPSGVMIAMNGPTPESAGTAQPPSIFADGTDFLLPEHAPIPQLRASIAEPGQRGDRLVLSYAAATGSRAGQSGEAVAALERLATGAMQAEDVIRSWMRQRADMGQRSKVFIGNFETREEARQLLDRLSDHGRAEIEHVQTGSGTLHALTVYPLAQEEEGVIRHAWALGAKDAFLVRE